MKKIFYSLIFATAALGFVACSDDDDNDNNGPDPIVEEVSEGAFILNQGSYYSQIEGSLDYMNYFTLDVTRGIFWATNGQSLGSTPQCGIAYGSHLYLGIYESNVLWVVNRTTCKIEKQLSCTMPRSLVADGGYVYISEYDGHVARLDTLNLAIDKTIEVSPNPEIMAIRNGYLYVPNSDGMNWPPTNYSASKIDLSSFAVVKTIATSINPTKFLSNGTDLFLLCMGDYAEIPAVVYKVGTDDSLTQIAEATLADCDSSYLYYINAPYGAESFEYKKCDLSTGVVSDLISDSGVDSPAALAVDPKLGQILITSYSMDNGWASYTTDGYLKMYYPDGSLIGKYTVGVGPCAIFFNVQ